MEKERDYPGEIDEDTGLEKIQIVVKYLWKLKNHLI